MARASVQRSAGGASRPKTAIIDCDIHNNVNGLADLFPYLSARWRRHAETIGLRGRVALAEGLSYPRNSPLACRADSWPVRGRPGSSLELMRRQHLDPHGIEIGVLNCLFPVGTQLHHGWAAALAQAVNDWQGESGMGPGGSPDLLGRQVRVLIYGTRTEARSRGSFSNHSTTPGPFPRQNA